MGWLCVQSKANKVDLICCFKSIYNRPNLWVIGIGYSPILNNSVMTLLLVSTLFSFLLLGLLVDL